MATVTGLTAERMLAIEAASIVDGLVDSNGHLILTTFGGALIDAGLVKGPMVTGVIDEFAGMIAPEGSVMCNGGTLSRITEARLFAVIGTAYGAGDGSTTFNVPLRKGRVGVGLDTTQIEFNAIGKTGGEKSHLLSNAEMPSHTHIQEAHNHTQNSHNHTQDEHNHTQNAHNHIQDAHGHSISAKGMNPQTLQYTASTSTTSNRYMYAAGVNDWVVSTVVAANQATTPTNIPITAVNQVATAVNQVSTAVNQVTGGGIAHNVMQPYITFNYIIYT